MTLWQRLVALFASVDVACPVSETGLRLRIAAKFSAHDPWPSGIVLVRTYDMAGRGAREYHCPLDEAEARWLAQEIHRIFVADTTP